MDKNIPGIARELVTFRLRTLFRDWLNQAISDGHLPPEYGRLSLEFHPIRGYIFTLPDRVQIVASPVDAGLLERERELPATTTLSKIFESMANRMLIDLHDAPHNSDAEQDRQESEPKLAADPCRIVS